MFTIKGLCEADEKIDREYIMLRETSNKSKIQMMGLSGMSNIIFDSSVTNVKIVSTDQSISILGYHSGIDKHPLGRKEWHLNGSCSSKTDGTEKTWLKITKVCSSLLSSYL